MFVIVQPHGLAMCKYAFNIKHSAISHDRPDTGAVGQQEFCIVNKSRQLNQY